MRQAALAVIVALLVSAGCDFGKDEPEPSSPELVRNARLQLYDHVPEPLTTRPSRGADEHVVFCRPTRLYCPGAAEARPTRTYFYVFRGQPDLTNVDFDLAETRQDFDVSTGEPIVLLRFTAEGAQEFNELTRRAPRTAGAAHIAIVVDDELVAAPVFDPTHNPEGIPPGTLLQINGIASVQEARNVALALRRSSGDRASAGKMEH